MSQRFTVQLPAGLDAPTLARTLVREHAADLPADLVDDAVICVSEVVANAVEHGQPEIILDLQVEQRRLGVQVTDHGEPLDPIDPLSTRRVDDQSPRGRGLRIIDTLTAAWGVTTHDDAHHHTRHGVDRTLSVGVDEDRPSKTVWFELYC